MTDSRHDLPPSGDFQAGMLKRIHDQEQARIKAEAQPKRRPVPDLISDAPLAVPKSKLYSR